MGTLASALLVGAPAWAQDAAGISSAIAERIESTFDLVLNNTAELAIPLTRRALARRSVEHKGRSEIAPLPYQEAAAAAAPDFAATLGPHESEPAPLLMEAASANEIEVARLPRPRPDRLAGSQSVDPTGEPLDPTGQPLDLVASAAPAPASEESAAAGPESQPAPAQPLGPILAAVPAGPAAELVATGECLSPSEVTDKDGDFKRNADTLSGNTFCIAEETFKERRHAWTLQTVKTSRPGPLWVVVHDDEDMSFDNAVQELKTYGGTLVTVETGGKRNLDGIDPNRNFSADGIGCRKLGTDAAPKFTAFFKDLLSPAEPIIALHNNNGGHVSTGGVGHVSMKSVPKDMRASPAPDENGPLAGEHALVLLAADDLDDPIAASRAVILNARGVNVVLEQVRDGSGDCSLSNYAVYTGHRDYFNVTVDHDERDKQQKIVDVIMAGRGETVATQ